MPWGKKSAKEGKPQTLSEPVQKYMVAEWKLSPDLVPLLKGVVRKNATGEMEFDIRVFDESEAIAMNVQVNDYTTLDEHPGLILYEGRFDETSKQVQLQEKKKINWDTPIFTEDEIRQKIEALRELGSTTFFYMAAGASHGGPLGMGAAVIELNPDYPGKKQKKYNIYFADVVDTQPVNRRKLFDSDKSKEVAHWVKQAHHKRVYES